MSITRVTQGSLGRVMLVGLSANMGRLASLQEQLSSGRQISKPSDDPVGTDAAMQYRGQLDRNGQYLRNAQDGLSWLGTADNALQSAESLVQRVRDLTVQGISGAAGQTSRDALAVQVESLREELLGLANTDYLGRPIFGGTTSKALAYADDGTGTIAYQGDAGTVSRTVGKGVQVTVNIDHAAAFGPAGADAFAVLKKVADDLRGSPGDLGNDLDLLDAVQQRMSSALATVGATYNRVDAMNTAAKNATTNLTASLNDVESTDVAKVATDLALQSAAYQAALSATAKIIQPSLADFLR